MATQQGPLGTPPPSQQGGNPQPVLPNNQAWGSMTQPQGIMWGGAPQYNANGTVGAPGTQPQTGAPVQSAGNPYYDPNSGQNAILPQGNISINAGDPNIMNSMQQFVDAAYHNQTARLDPQWQQQQNAFDAQMVAQGLQPGSAAYNNAYQNFVMGRNDAYNQAYNNSFQTGLAAQGQAFNQAALPEQLRNALNVASINAGGQVGAAGEAASASMYNNAANNATNQLLGLGNLGLGYGNLQNQTNQQDFGNLMTMLGYGNQQDMYNNGLVGGADNTLLGLIPNGNPSMVDVTGAYNLNQAGQNAAYQGQLANANAQNQMYGSLLQAGMMMMMMCSRDWKDDHGEADADKTLEAVNSLPLRNWSYKHDQTKHVGTYAEEFNKALGLPPSQAISVIDMLGAILGSVQALTKRIEKVEAHVIR